MEEAIGAVGEGRSVQGGGGSSGHARKSNSCLHTCVTGAASVGSTDGRTANTKKIAL